MFVRNVLCLCVDFWSAFAFAFASALALAARFLSLRCFATAILARVSAGEHGGVLSLA